MKRLRLAYVDRVGAGASAEQRYKQLAGAWWARVRLRALLCILVVPALALAGRIKSAAADLSDDLARATGRKVWVTPVVVLWAPFEQRSVEQNGVRWIHGKALRDWIESDPPKLAEARAEQLAQAVKTMPRQQ